MPGGIGRPTDTCESPQQRWQAVKAKDFGGSQGGFRRLGSDWQGRVCKKVWIEKCWNTDGSAGLGASTICEVGLEQ